ncbi:MAG TPA: mammalian cell entry protein [Burkholderiales bacterium]|nr:mammalian cell entry protein [Burkholderiales bacterium]
MEPRFTPIPKNLQFRMGLLLGLTVVVVAVFVIYVLYARGVFEASQRLTLVSDNAEGVGIGMDLTFSGFPVGRVYRIALAEDGRARIDIRVPLKDARWLKQSTIFTMERGIVGSAKLRAITANLQDAPLPDGAERNVLRGDTTEEIPRLVATLRGVLENAEEMTKQGGSIQASLANLRAVSERLAGKSGALAAVLGSEDDARKVIATIDRANALLGSIAGVSKRLDDLLVKTDKRVYGEGGVMDGTQRAVAQANAILGDVKESLKRVDAILADAQVVSANAKSASGDLAALRAEVDVSVRKIGGLVDEINRKWPFERKTEIKLP